ncbi:MAG TPA: diiron oxygenase [Acidimicrobiales bacterium]|nr:diiron oxygenase [Acidimicrobiales bacterium]
MTFTDKQVSIIDRDRDLESAEAPGPADTADTADLGDIADAQWISLVERLNRLSVTKHFEAYSDVAWDDEEMRLDPEDERWELPLTDSLGATEWYRGLPQAERAQIGCELVASKMKIGLIFESVLKRGLLEFASTLPNGAPEFRYSYHEVIEEAQHSLMFQEFVNRSGFDAAGLRAIDEWASRRIVLLGRRFPQLFFLFVLGGEDPIDYVQRRELRGGGKVHPLLERIMRIHVTEEARHLSFARHYLLRTVPKLGFIRRVRLAIGAPIILGVMAQMMLKPSPQIVSKHQIPPSIIREAFTRSPQHRAETIASLAKVRKLCDELGLVRRPYDLLWKALKISD